MSEAFPLVLPWILITLTAAYYLTVMCRDHRPGAHGWLVAGGICVGGATVVGEFAVWIAAITTFLSLCSLVPFGCTWAGCIAEFGAPQGMVPRALLTVECALIPIATLGVVLRLATLGVAIYSIDSFWIAANAGVAIIGCVPPVLLAGEDRGGFVFGNPGASAASIPARLERRRDRRSGASQPLAPPSARSPRRTKRGENVWDTPLSFRRFFSHRSSYLRGRLAAARGNRCRLSWGAGSTLRGEGHGFTR